MTNLAGLPPLGLKPEREAEDPERLRRIRQLPCCICEEYGMVQTSLTQAHHCIHGRYSGRKRPDSMVIPLCAEHHNFGMDHSEKVSLHRQPAEWKRLYGEDVGWISWTEERLSND